MDSELIPLESGETCVAAIMTAQSENSKEISIVREWLLAGKFPSCVQEFCTRQLRTEGILDWQKEFIPGHREHFVEQSFSHRGARTASRTTDLVQHSL